MPSSVGILADDTVIMSKHKDSMIALRRSRLKNDINDIKSCHISFSLRKATFPRLNVNLI